MNNSSLVGNESREYELFAVRVSHESESSRVSCCWRVLEALSKICICRLVLVDNIHMSPKYRTVVIVK